MRTHDFAEADRVVVLLTREHGIVRAVAKGVRRAKSRFGSRLQYFVDLDVLLYPGRNLATIAGADTVEFFGSGIIEDYERYTLACAILESAEKITGTIQGDSAAYDRVVAALRELQTTAYPTLVADAFMLQSMRAAGWCPELFSCVQCQKAGPHHAFSPAYGGAVCGQCRPPGLHSVAEATLHLMWLLAYQHPAAAIALVESLGRAGLEVMEEADKLTRSHVQFHVEGRIRSFQVLEH